MEVNDALRMYIINDLLSQNIMRKRANTQQ